MDSIDMLDVLERRIITCSCRDSKHGSSRSQPSHYTDYATATQLESNYSLIILRVEFYTSDISRNNVRI